MVERHETEINDGGLTLVIKVEVLLFTLVTKPGSSHLSWLLALL